MVVMKSKLFLGLWNKTLGIEKREVVTTEIYNKIVIIIIIVAIINSFYRAKNGPNKRQRNKIERKQGNTLTEEDIKFYKLDKLIGGVDLICVGFLIILLMYT